MKIPTQSICKLVRSLKLKKHRDKNKIFVAEGENNFEFLLNSTYKIKYVIIQQSFYEKNKSKFDSQNIDFYICENEFFNKLTNLENLTTIVSVVEYPEKTQLQQNKTTIVLDNIRDPGNLGTIIRICDWYNIPNIVLSENCVDIYNPKVLTSSCGSFVNINYIKANLIQFFETQKDRSIIGTKIEGQSIREYKFPNNPIIIIGNESKGISKELDPYLSDTISIPKYGNAESLNAAVSLGIIVDNFRRR